MWGEGEATTAALHDAALLVFGGVLAKQSFCKHSPNNPLFSSSSTPCVPSRVVGALRSKGGKGHAEENGT